MIQLRSWIKNILLVSGILIIGHLPKLFFTEFGSDARWNMGLIIERPTRPDYWILHYSWSINFLIIAYCYYYSSGVQKGVKRFILIVAGLDIIHIILLSKQGFGIVKVGVAILIYYLHYFFKIKTWWLHTLKKWIRSKVFLRL